MSDNQDQNTACGTAINVQFAAAAAGGGGGSKPSATAEEEEGAVPVIQSGTSDKVLYTQSTSSQTTDDYGQQDEVLNDANRAGEHVGTSHVRATLPHAAGEGGEGAAADGDRDVVASNANRGVTGPPPAKNCRVVAVDFKLKLRDIPAHVKELPNIVFADQQRRSDQQLSESGSKAARLIRLAVEYMEQCKTPAHDFGDIGAMIRLLDRWGLLENAGALESVIDDYDHRLKQTACAQEAELRLFDNLSALVPLDEHNDPEEGEMSNNTFLPEAKRLHDVIFDPPDRRTLTSKTPATRLAVRDIIPCPASYDITPWWIMQMMSSFWLLIVLTFINIDLMNLNYLIEPYVDSSDGCFFESRSDCCNPKLNSAFTSSASATTTELYARDVNRSCCSFNCMWNNETFSHYRDRWIDFVGASVGDCARMLLAVGGARVEDTAELTGANMLYVPGEWILSLNSSDSSKSYINATALQDNFAPSCKDSEACQRFIIITQQQFHKTWTNLLSTKRVIHYVVFVESSWRFIDAGCQSNSRRIIVPMVSDTEFSTGALIGGWILFATAFAALLATPYVLNLLHVPINNEKTATRGVMFAPFVWTSVLMLCILLAMSFCAALLSPEPISGLLLLAFCAALRCFFSIVSFLRLIARLWDSVFGKPHENVLFAHLHGQRAKKEEAALHDRFEAFTSVHENDSECPHSTTWAETLVSLLCCFYFMSMSGILRDIELKFVGNANRSYLIDLFDKWIYHRSLFTIFHLAFVPIGLELVLYVPAWIGYATDSTLPRLRWLVVFYGIVFVWFPNSATSFPTTLDEIGKAVLGFTSQLVTDFGPLGSGQRRLGYAFALLLLFFVFLQLIYDMEAAVLMKPWVVLRAYFIRVYADIHYPNLCAFRSKHPGVIGAERAALLTAVAHLPGIRDALDTARAGDPSLAPPIEKRWKDVLALFAKSHEWRFDHREGIDLVCGLGFERWSRLHFEAAVPVTTSDWTWLAQLLPPSLFVLEIRNTPKTLPNYICYRGWFTPTIQIVGEHNHVSETYDLACVCVGPTAFVRRVDDQWHCLTTNSCSVCSLTAVRNAFTNSFPHASVYARQFFIRRCASDAVSSAAEVILNPVNLDLFSLPRSECPDCKRICVNEKVLNSRNASTGMSLCVTCTDRWPDAVLMSVRTTLGVKPPTTPLLITPTATCVGVSELNEKAAARIATSNNIRTVCIVNSVKISRDLPPLPQVQRLLFLNKQRNGLSLKLADADRFAATFPNLLELSAHWISDDETLTSLSKCAKLQALDIAVCGKITGIGLQKLQPLNATLLSLNLHHCNLISDTGLRHLHCLKALRLLDISDCYMISDTAKQSLKRAIPNLEITS